jgi:hypothetical protein
MSFCKYAVVPVIACLGAAPPAFASEVSYFPQFVQYVVDFGAFPLGTGTPFSETVGSLTIFYSAPNDPGAFQTVDSTSIPASSSPLPWLLGKQGSSALGLTLSRPAFGVGVEYLTLGPGPIQMDLVSGGLGGSITRTQSAGGPQGFISFLPVCICPNDFDAILLSDSTDPSFAIQRVYIVESYIPGVPESSALALLAVGLVMLAAMGRLRAFRLSDRFQELSHSPRRPSRRARLSI